MGFRGQFAQQQSQAVHVRFGSKADIGALPINVRFTPKSGHSCAADNSTWNNRERVAVKRHFASTPPLFDLGQRHHIAWSGTRQGWTTKALESLSAQVAADRCVSVRLFRELRFLSYTVTTVHRAG